MFKADQTIRFIYKRFELHNLAIDKAGVCDSYDIGGDAGCQEPDAYSYEECAFKSYSYGLDSVILTINRIIHGYFIGDVGYNSVPTPYTSTEDLVYELYEIWLNIVYEENEEPREFLLLFDYLIDHAKLNKCKLLQLKKDNTNRYQLFYQNIKTNFGFKELGDYLIKKI